MWVSTAVQLTPEMREQLFKELGQGPDGEATVRLFRDFLTPPPSESKPSLTDLAKQSGMSHQAVRRIAELLNGAKPSTMAEAFATIFISYGGPDEHFARKLYQELFNRGVTAFFFPESATPGQRLHRTMCDGIQEYDRALLLCSANSLTRPGVLNELEQILAREAREGGAELLIPVLLDDYALNEWSPKKADLARQVRDRVAADFRNSNDEDTFQKQCDRLMEALKATA